MKKIIEVVIPMEVKVSIEIEVIVSEVIKENTTTVNNGVDLLKSLCPILLNGHFGIIC